MQNNTSSTETILSNLKIEALNEMQLASIQANEESDNVILLSTTGSGKTLAYLLPVVQLLKPELKKVQALILVPSRELAIQIDEVFRKMACGYKVTCCYGGHKRETEENNLKQSPSVIIQKVISGKGYFVKIGAGGGYHFGNWTYSKPLRCIFSYWSSSRFESSN